MTNETWIIVSPAMAMADKKETRSFPAKEHALRAAEDRVLRGENEVIYICHVVAIARRSVAFETK